MKKILIILLILIVLGAGGFCLYWFVFRNTSDGGKLTNKEVLFAVQNVLENNQIDLKDYLDEPQKVTFNNFSTKSACVYADGESEKLTDAFANDLTKVETVSEAELSKMNENLVQVCLNILVPTWKLLYSNVFGGVSVKQNVWYEQIYYTTVVEDGIETKKEINRTYLKVVSETNSSIKICTFDKEEKKYIEVILTYNFRNTDVDYSILLKGFKITTELNADTNKNDEVYNYVYINIGKQNSKYSYYENAQYESKKKYIAVSNEKYDVSNIVFSLFNNESENVYTYVNGENGDEIKNNAFKYLVEKFDLTYYGYDGFDAEKSQTMKLIKFKK